jgi:hypothetical protein
VIGTAVMVGRIATGEVGAVSSPDGTIEGVNTIRNSTERVGLNAPAAVYLAARLLRTV